MHLKFLGSINDPSNRLTSARSACLRAIARRRASLCRNHASGWTRSRDNSLVTRELGCPPPRPNLSGSLKLSGIAAYNHLLNKDMKTPLTLQQTGLALLHNKTRIEPASGSGRITGTEKFQAPMSHLRSRLMAIPRCLQRVRSRRHYCANIDRDQWRIRR